MRKKNRKTSKGKQNKLCKKVQRKRGNPSETFTRGMTGKQKRKVIFIRAKNIKEPNISLKSGEEISGGGGDQETIGQRSGWGKRGTKKFSLSMLVFSNKKGGKKGQKKGGKKP